MQIKSLNKSPDVGGMASTQAMTNNFLTSANKFGGDQNQAMSFSFPSGPQGAKGYSRTDLPSPNTGAMYKTRNSNAQKLDLFVQGTTKGHNRNQTQMSMTQDARAVGEISHVARNLVQTPDRDGSRRNQSYQNNSINFKDMRGKLDQARSKMKSQNQSRFKGRNGPMFDTNFQGGFQTGFVNQSQNDTNYRSALKQSQSVVSGRKGAMTGVLSQAGDFETRADTNEFNFNKSRLSAKTHKPPPIQEVVDSYSKLYNQRAKPKFGIPNYEIHDNMQKEPYFKIHKIAIAKKDKAKDHFMDDYVKVHGPKPAPGKYKTEFDWNNNFKNRGKFFKQPKITFTESMIIEAKRDYRKAAPNSYFKDGDGLKHYIGKNLKKMNSKGAQSDKFCGFTESAKWYGQQTAFGHKHTPKFTITDPHEKAAKIWKQNEKSTDKRIDKIVKDKTKPAPGEYNTMEAWRKTKLGNREYTQPKAKLVNFTEIIKNNKKFIPSPATYKVDIKMLDRLSCSPCLKAKRH